MQAWKSAIQNFKYQIYISRSLDPFLNLSIEHYLLQTSPPTSTILFLYVNRPCVVIGRNQNPWLEVDLDLLQRPRASDRTRHVDGKAASPPWERVQLVRRRSGGGTVFHDEGNVNYSVVCPTAHFSRDRHAEMVTRALRGKNLRARVNERHDIVLDQGSLLEAQDWPDATDMHRTMFRPRSEKSPPLKVSGSAYKMTRLRSLHHGTCLLASMNLPGISQYLRSPSQPFIKARGVESVRSPIGNVRSEPKGPTQMFNGTFKMDVIRSFAKLYGIERTPSVNLRAPEGEIFADEEGEWVTSCVGSQLGEIDEIQAGVEELQVSEDSKGHIQTSAHNVRIQSSRWLYGQTPQFTLSSHSIEEDKRERPPLPEEFPPSVRRYLHFLM